MTLYGAAKAPAVAKNDDGTTQGDMVDSTTGAASSTDELVDVGGAFSQTTLNNNFATLAAKINALIAHMNDGRS